MATELQSGDDLVAAAGQAQNSVQRHGSAMKSINKKHLSATAEEQIAKLEIVQGG